MTKETCCALSIVYSVLLCGMCLALFSSSSLRVSARNPITGEILGKGFTAWSPDDSKFGQYKDDSAKIGEWSFSMHRSGEHTIFKGCHTRGDSCVPVRGVQHAEQFTEKGGETLFFVSNSRVWALRVESDEFDVKVVLDPSRFFWNFPWVKAEISDLIYTIDGGEMRAQGTLAWSHLFGKSHKHAVFFRGPYEQPERIFHIGLSVAKHEESSSDSSWDSSSKSSKSRRLDDKGQEGEEQEEKLEENVDQGMAEVKVDEEPKDKLAEDVDKAMAKIKEKLAEDVARHELMKAALRNHDVHNYQKPWWELIFLFFGCTPALAIAIHFWMGGMEAMLGPLMVILWFMFSLLYSCIINEVGHHLSVFGILSTIVFGAHLLLLVDKSSPRPTSFVVTVSVMYTIILSFVFLGQRGALASFCYCALCLLPLGVGCAALLYVPVLFAGLSLVDVAFLVEKSIVPYGHHRVCLVLLLVLDIIIVTACCWYICSWPLRKRGPHREVEMGSRPQPITEPIVPSSDL